MNDSRTERAAGFGAVGSLAAAIAAVGSLAATVFLAAAISLTATASLAAQDGTSIFTLLDPQDRQLTAGDEVSGELTEADFVAGGRRVQAWAVEAQEGAALQIDMVSEVIDPYLYVTGPGLGELSDDDSGEGTNSRLCVEFPASGTYRVVASSFGGTVGPYRIQAVDRATCAGGLTGGSEVTDLSTLETGDRSVPWADEAMGSLTTADPVSFSSPVQAWAVEGRAGETLTIDLVSTEFDAYLTVLGPGLAEWIGDDDGAGRCDSRVTVTFPEDGTYRAVVSSVAGGTGGFTLATHEDPPAPRPGACIPPTSSSAEVSTSVAELPTAGSVEVGGSVSSDLTGDGRYQSRPAERWTLEAREGQALAIEQTSDVIDSYLYLKGPGFENPLYNDDTDGLNSRICVTIPETGSYDIVSAGFGSGDTGPYRLSVRADPDGEICDEFLVSLQSGFARLPLEGAELAPGAEVAGSLDPTTDERHPVDGSLIDVYALEVEAGETRVVDLVSEQFDAFMYVAGPGLGNPISDDDGGGRCNARIELFAPESGTYRVVVNALSETGAGDYTLRVGTEPGPVARGDCTGSLTGPPVSAVAATSLDHVRPATGRTVPVGAEVLGELTADDPVIEDAKRAQAWAFDAAPGENVVVEVLSEDFDTYLYVTGPGLDGVLADDDGAPGTNSRIELTPDRAGTYRVVVSSYGADASGAFRLRVLRRAAGR